MSREILRYISGEEIKADDRVFFHCNPAKIAFVTDDPDDPEHAWYVQTYGRGVMVLHPIASGRTFIRADQLAKYEDLEFVSQADELPNLPRT